MLCQNCHEYSFFQEMEYYFVNSILFKPIDYFLKYCNENLDVNLVCDNCNTKILVGDLYYEDESLLDEAKKDVFYEIANEVMKNIKACTRCNHGNDMRDLKHRIESIYDDEDDDPEAIYGSYHSSTELRELIGYVSDFPEEYFEDIVEYIQCPHCDNGSGIDWREKIDNGKFDLDTEIYTDIDIKYFEENFYGETYKEINNEIKRIADVCTYEELVELKSEFLKNQVFIVQNGTFGKIYNLLKEQFNEGNYLLLHKSKRLYRARVNEDKSLFPKEKMWEAPIEKTRQNRYNTSGLPVLYCGNTKEKLFKEVPNTTDNGYTFATKRLLKSFKMFKINPVFGYGFQGFIEEQVPEDFENNEFKTQYIITNIMALITKKVGFDGIVYLSVKDKNLINYAFLNFEKDKDIEIISCSYK